MKRYFNRIDIKEKSKRVQRIDFRPVVQNATGIVTLTDLMLQEGAQLSGHLPATREMLRRLRENNLPAGPKFFNALIRGRQTLIIPNRGAWRTVVLNAPVVPTAIDFTVLAKTAIPAGMQFSHFYRTRRLSYGNPLTAGDMFEFLASQRVVRHNGISTRFYTGFYHQCAAGNSRFNIDLMDEGATIRPQPTARILIEIQEWELASGGRRV